MRTLIYPLSLAAFFLCMASCQKGPSLDDQLLSTRRYLITGKWLITSADTKVYSAENLVKDTTISYVSPSSSASSAWYYIFNRDSTAFITTLPYTKTGSTKLYTDTTARLRYTIQGDNVIFTDTMNKPVEQSRLAQLTGYTLEFVSSSTGAPPTGWNLDATKKYSFVKDQTFIKQ